jgi:Na+(H+)/acetate symporter ActP
MYTTYSLMLATFLGTMGLPHVVVRFYTNPDGRAARRTTLTVLVLLGLFYVLPPVYGALGHLYAGDLATGSTDSVVLELPSRMLGSGIGPELLSALVTAGAFAAFLSTSSGLTIAVAGVISQDLVAKRWGNLISGVLAFRLAAVVAVVVPLCLALAGSGAAVATVVGLAFALAAATFCPLLVLGIWWRGLTDVGAIAGMLTGGILTSIAIVDTLAIGDRAGWAGVLISQPAAWAVPLAFTVMVVVSLATPHRRPAHVSRFMVRLHTPEGVRLDRGPAPSLID